MPAAPTTPVSSRLVVLFPGFEPLPVEAHFERFRRALAASPPLYGHRFAAGDPSYREVVPGLRVCRFEVEAAGTSPCRTTVIIYGLAAFNRIYAARPPAVRLLSGLRALLDFVVSGTFFRYLATSWRYGLFFLFPIALLAAIAGSGLLVFSILPGWHWVLACLSAAALMLLLMLAADRSFHLLLMLDLWSCARDMADGGNANLRELITAATADSAEQVRRAEVDEVLLAAHSLGAVTAVAACARTMRAGCVSAPIGLVTVGSNLLQVALHPAAHRLRGEVKDVLDSAALWLDVQSLTDPLNFHDSDPAQALGLGQPGRVGTLRIRFRDQLLPETYRRIKLNFYRVHRQFVYGVELPTGYSFHVILCGPYPFSAIMSGLGLPPVWLDGLAEAPLVEPAA